MNALSERTKLFVAAFLFVGVVFLIASYIVDQHEKELNAAITLAVVEQEKTLVTLAEITDKNGADPITESIIVDCKLKDRMRFDELLGGLTTLTPAELTETQNLFDKCADFFAQRKKLMVARMEREYEVYASMVDMLTVLDDPIAVERFDVHGWRELLGLEKRRSEIFTERVRIQEGIIASLIGGEAPNSKNIQEQVAQAREMTEEVLVVDQQSDSLRATLLDL